jgi:Flp pilus assembly protein TadG
MVPKRRRNPEKRDERGAVLVEAAFVLPLLLFFLFGIIEFGGAYKDSLTVESATRTGARTASALPRDATMNSAVANAVATAVKALPASGPKELWIYKAQTDGTPAGTGNFTNCGASTCWKFTWNSSSQTWTAVNGYTWDPLTQNACTINGGPDSVGIYITAEHTFVSGMFNFIFPGGKKTLTDRTVMRLEPVASSSGVCS